MRLADVVGQAGMAGFAEAGLALAVAGFLVLLMALVRRRNQPGFERARHLPLDEAPSCPEPGALGGQPGQGGREKADG